MIIKERIVDSMSMKARNDMNNRAIKHFVEYLNSNSQNSILVGSAALRLCYGETVNPVKIELESSDRESIHKIIENYCYSNSCSYKVKNTNNSTVSFYIVENHGHVQLEVNVVYKDNIDKSNVVVVNWIVTYDIKYAVKSVLSDRDCAFSVRASARKFYCRCFQKYSSHSNESDSNSFPSNCRSSCLHLY